MKNTIKINSKNVKMVAHRGLSGLGRENTCRAFIAAGNREKYYGIETDVHATADGKYVTIHDGVTGRVSTSNIEIATSTFDEVRSILLTDTDGSTDCADIRIPTLEEYISICKRYGKVAVLELKCNFTEEQVKEIIDIIKAEDYLESVTFISFIREPLVIVRKLLPEQKIQYLACEFNDEILNFMKEYRLDYDVHGGVPNEENMKLLKEAGIEVNVWTIDDPALASKLIDLGVDYITTNILE
jgi:glycerophosphoryl diester phosphodiesterase